MYTVKIKVRTSDIEGKGVFAAEKVSKGKIVWLYDSGKDLAVTQEEFAKFDQDKKDWFHHSAYLSPWTGLWICPPENDASNYTNHGAGNNLTAQYDPSVSSEPFFIANRDIEVGEEITNNYHEFDTLTRATNPEWAKIARRK